MKKVKVSRMSLALILFFMTGLATTGDYAQQPPAASGQANSPATQSPNATPDPTTTPAVPSDKVVIKVGDTQVTAADFDFLLHTLNTQDQKNVATQGRQPLAEQYILTLLLEQQGLRDHLDSTQEFRRQEAIERAQRLAQAEYEKMARDIQVAPQEITQYYAAHTAELEQVAVRQVGIRKKAAGGKPDAPGLSPEEAKARAEQIRKALAAGTDPKQVAKDFAVPSVVFVDTQERNIQHGQLPGDWDQTLFKLKDGEISENLDTPQSIAFLQVVRHIHPELKDVQQTVEQEVRQEKLKAKIAELKNGTTVWTDQDYFKTPEKPVTGPAAPPPLTPKPPAAAQPAPKPPADQQPPKQ